MAKRRIQVYADEETKRRIELAAAKHGMPVTEYCLVAIEQQLADDDVLEGEKIEIPIKPARESDYISRLRKLREAILAERGGKPIEVDIPSFIDQIREERHEQLSSVH